MYRLLCLKNRRGPFWWSFLAQKDNELSAFKFIRIESQIAMNKYSSEAVTMTENESTNMIKLYSQEKVCILEQWYLVLFQEYVIHGDLRDFIYRYGYKFSLKQIVGLMANVTTAVFVRRFRT